MKRTTIALVIATLLVSTTARAETSTASAPVEVLGQATAAASSEFKGTDAGFGALVSWRALPFLGAEAETNFYPKDLTVNGGAPFSSGRIEALFGISVGPTLGGVVRPYGTFRMGFVHIQGAPGPLACVAIFPPTLGCSLARGETVIADEIGGGVEWLPGPHGVLRAELGDRLMHYPGPAIDAGGRRHDTA